MNYEYSITNFKTLKISKRQDEEYIIFLLNNFSIFIFIIRL